MGRRRIRRSQTRTNRRYASTASYTQKEVVKRRFSDENEFIVVDTV